MKHFIGAIKDDTEREHMYRNYLELMKKPQPEVCDSPGTNIDLNYKATSVEKKAEDKEENSNLTFPNGDIDELEERNKSDKDPEALTSTNTPVSDTVDFGPAAESKDDNKNVPFIDGDNDDGEDHDTRTFAGEEQQTECVNVDNNDHSSDIGDTGVNFGSVIEVKL